MNAMLDVISNLPAGLFMIAMLAVIVVVVVVGGDLAAMLFGEKTLAEAWLVRGTALQLGLRGSTGNKIPNIFVPIKERVGKGK